jgi:hypothetical protein
MVGTGKGMVATEDLKLDMVVTMDDQKFEVVKVAGWTNGMTKVTLYAVEPGVEDTVVDVATVDAGEPIWELA